MPQLWCSWQLARQSRRPASKGKLARHAIPASWKAMLLVAPLLCVVVRGVVVPSTAQPPRSHPRLPRALGVNATSLALENREARVRIAQDKSPSKSNGLGSNALTTNGLTNNCISPNGLKIDSQTFLDGLGNLTLTQILKPTNGQALADNFAAALEAALLPAPSPAFSLQDLPSHSLSGLSFDANKLTPDTLSFLKYLVSCALSPSQTVSVVPDAPEKLKGELGLAPAWYNGPISQTEQKLVSACILARVNFFGVSVIISMRGPNIPDLAVDAAEASAFPSIEGAFWGDLFAANAKMFSCGTESTALNSYRNLRVCSTGLPTGGSFVSCGPMQHVGSCASVCKVQQAATGPVYGSCSGSSSVMTVYLPKV